MKYYSQFKQDQFIYENFFQGKSNGYFVDTKNYQFITRLGCDEIYKK